MQPMVYLNVRKDALYGTRIIYLDYHIGKLYDIFVKTVYGGIVITVLALYIWLAISDYRQ